MRTNKLSKLVVALAMMAAVAACSTSSGELPGSALQASGIALPEGYSLDRSRTLITGEGDRWTGRLSYTINSNPNDMFDFYRRQMPGFGWQELAVTRAEPSVLTFASPGTGRIATVQIADRMLIGSRVNVTVSPGTTGSTVNPPSPMRPGDVPPSQAAPRGSVSSQPLN